MSKELAYLYEIWATTVDNWERHPYPEEVERFLAIEKALKRNEPMKPEPIKEQLVEWGTNKNMGKDIRRLCPKCNHIVDNHYCSECGQKINWER